MDDIEDCFRLCQVDPAVEKSTFRKFARAGGTGTQRADGLKDRFHNQGISMAGDFDHIFSSVGLWIWPRSHDNFVEGGLVVMKFNGNW